MYKRQGHGGSASPADITVTLSSRADATGEVTVESFKFIVGGTGGTAFPDADKTAVLNAVNNQLKHITCYKDGYAYLSLIHI